MEQPREKPQREKAQRNWKQQRQSSTCRADDTANGRKEGGGKQTEEINEMQEQRLRKQRTSGNGRAEREGTFTNIKEDQC